MGTSIKAIATEIAKREGKLKEVSIGNIREIIGIISDLEYETWENEDTPALSVFLYSNGKRRAKRKAK